MTMLFITDDPDLAYCQEQFCVYCGEPLDPEGYWSNETEALFVDAGGLGRAWCTDECQDRWEPRT